MHNLQDICDLHNLQNINLIFFKYTNFNIYT